jgi:YD repeat-containing protein
MVQIWEVATSKDSILNLKSKLAFQSGIANLIWNPRGDKLAIAGSDGVILIAETDAAKKTRSLRGHSAAVHFLSWSPEGKRLASVSGDGTIKVWDVAKGKEAYSKPLPGNPMMLNPVPALGTTWALVWTADGKLIKGVRPDGQVTSWNAADGQEGQTCPLAPRDFGWSPGQRSRFAWRPDGKLFASAVAGQVRIWDGASGKEVHAFLSPAGRNPMSFVQCAPTWDEKGRWVGLGGSDGSVQAWPVGLKRPSVRNPLPNAQGWTHDGHLLCKPSASLNAVPGLVETPAMKEALEAINKAARTGRLTTPDPKAIAGGPGEPRGILPGPEPQVQFQVCDSVTGQVLRTYAKQASGLNVMAESPDGKWVATYGSILQLWSMPSGEGPIPLQEPGAKAPVRSFGPGPSQQALVAWSPDSSKVALWSPNQDTIRIWDAATHLLIQILDEKDNPLRCLAWCPDSNRLASAGEQGQVKIWDVNGGKTTSTFRFFYNYNAPNRGLATDASSMLAWSPDARYLAVAGEDEKIQIRDVDKEEDLPSLLGRAGNKGFIGILCAVAWSPKGQRLAAASPDGTFILYDTANWREAIALRIPNEGPFHPRIPLGGGKLAWSPDGQQLAFFGGGGVIWDGTPDEKESK